MCVTLSRLPFDIISEEITARLPQVRYGNSMSSYIAVKTTQTCQRTLAKGEYSLRKQLSILEPLLPFNLIKDQ